MGWETVAIQTTASLPYLLITVKVIALEKVSLVICKIERLFFNALTAYNKRYLPYRDNLTESIQMQLSQKQKNFLNFLGHF